MIEGGTDDVLTSLAGHLGFTLERRPDRLEPTFWRKGYFRLFVSHLAEFREEAASLQEQLTGCGVSAFVAHNDIAPSAEWQNEIEAALATADCLVALLRPGFHASKWTDQEVGYAMGRSLPVFSVRLGEDPYGFIGRFQAFQGSKKDAATLATEVFEVLVKHKQTSRRMTEALVLRMEESDSFAQAKSNIGRLEQAIYWHPSFNERLKTARETNSQIQGSWGVSDRIKRLIASRPDSGV
jgi:nucleoside 2-deoxyribosyltransferase